MILTIQTVDGPEEYEFGSEGFEAESDIVQTESFEGILLESDGFEAANRVKHTFELGSIDGVPEVKTVHEKQCKTIKVEGFKKKICWRLPVFYRRTSKVTLYGDISLPSDVNSRVESALRGCAIGAVGAAIASMIASPAASLPAFKTTLVGCLTTAAGDLADKLISEIDLGLYTKQVHHGPWKRSS